METRAVLFVDDDEIMLRSLERGFLDEQFDKRVSINIIGYRVNIAPEDSRPVAILEANLALRREAEGADIFAGRNNVQGEFDVSVRR